MQKTLLLLPLLFFFLSSCFFSDALVARKHLKQFLNSDFVSQVEEYLAAEIIAVATFPANDFFPGEGNGLSLFKKGESGFTAGSPSYPRKVAGKYYAGYHTGYKKRFLESPVGVFPVHRGSKNGSRSMSWKPEILKTMAVATNIPAVGVKVGIEQKPQKHFHYAIHCLPPHYDEERLRKRAFSSLGCWSLLIPDMRDFFNVYGSYPSKKRLLVSIYDTISVDVVNQKIFIYKDIYKRKVNTLAVVQEELKRAGVNPRAFDKKKIKVALELSKKEYRQAYSFEDLR